jgi:GNAT superfamily N-acetyltransferase
MVLDSKAIDNEYEFTLGTNKYFLFNYDRLKFSDKEWDEYLEYDYILRDDTIPDSPVPCKELRRTWLSMSSESNVSNKWIVVTSDEKIVARLFLSYCKDLELNKCDTRSANIYLDVLPSYRGNGLGSYLIEFGIEKAKSQNINELHSEYETETGKRLAEKYGFEVNKSNYFNRLYRKNLDLDMLKEWSKNSEVEVLSEIPDELMEEYCNMLNECNQIASDNGYYDFEESTEKSIRAIEKEHADQGLLDLYCIILKDKKIIGVTQLHYFEMDPWFVTTGFTGILRNQQGKGYGRAVKAYSILELLKRNQDFQYIETSNNIKNDPILKINKSMGFQEYQGESLVEKKL